MAVEWPEPASGVMPRRRVLVALPGSEPPHRAIDDLQVVWKRARDHREVGALQIVIAKPARQLEVRVIVLGEDDQAAGLEIDAMDDGHGRRSARE